MMEFREGYVSAVARSAGDARELFGESEFDVIVVSSSWDGRALSLTECDDLHASLGVLVALPRDDQQLVERHEEELRRWLGSSCDAMEGVDAVAHDVEAYWSEVSTIIDRVRERVHRPISVLMDLSASPRFIALSLLALIKDGGTLSRIAFLYSEGAYPEETSEEEKYEMFTEGGWDTLAIPGLEGEWDPEWPWEYVVSVGFEGAKTLRLVSRAEPDRVAVLFPDPGVHESYVERATERNQQLLSMYSSSEVMRAHAGDAVSAWRAMSEGAKRNGGWNRVLVCCGTKAHSLGMALFAMSRPECAVLYVRPDRHRVVDVQPNGVFWRFDVTDESSPE